MCFIPAASKGPGDVESITTQDSTSIAALQVESNTDGRDVEAVIVTISTAAFVAGSLSRTTRLRIRGSNKEGNEEKQHPVHLF